MIRSVCPVDRQQQQIKLTHVGFRAHVKIAYRIVTAAGGFAAGRQEISINRCGRRAATAAFSSKCGQRRVYNRCTKDWTQCRYSAVFMAVILWQSVTCWSFVETDGLIFSILLRIDSTDFPDCLRIRLSISFFYFLLFLFFTFLVFGSVRKIKLTLHQLRAHVKIASRIDLFY